MKWLLTIPLLLVLSSCNNHQSFNKDGSDAAKNEYRLHKVKWILGNWSMPGEKGTFHESWQQSSDTLFTGTGFLISGKGDTLFTEHLKLADSAGTLWYIPQVSNQNNAEEVPFRETKSSEAEIVFENLAHDFPQRIIYRKTTAASIYARVEGMQNGKMRAEEFRMVKE
jgi:hypothetical protein